MNLPLALLAAAGGAGLSIPLVRYSAARVTAQPIAENAQAERLLLALAAQRNRSLPSELAATPAGDGLDPLAPGHFAHPGRADAWATIEELGDRDAPADRGGDAIRAARAEDIDALTKELAPRLAQDKVLPEATAEIVACAQERDLYPGSAPIELTDGDPAYVRVHQDANTRRKVLSAAGLAGGFAACVGVASSLNQSPAATVLAALALMVTWAVGWAIALIDLDTMFVDFRTLFTGGAAAWVIAGVAAVAAGDPGRLGSGALTILAWIGFLVGVAKLYELVTGVNGVGGGDIYIAAVTAAVPAVVAGSFTLGFWSVLFSMFIAIGAYVPRMVAGSHGRREAFAFGPYLAVGWLAAWPFLALTHAL